MSKQWSLKFILIFLWRKQSHRKIYLESETVGEQILCWCGKNPSQNCCVFNVLCASIWWHHSSNPFNQMLSVRCLRTSDRAFSGNLCWQSHPRRQIQWIMWKKKNVMSMVLVLLFTRWAAFWLGNCGVLSPAMIPHTKFVPGWNRSWCLLSVHVWSLWLKYRRKLAQVVITGLPESSESCL